MSESNFEDYMGNSSVYNPNNDSDALKLRLDTEKMITEIEACLRGTKDYVIESTDGRLSMVKQTIGVPKMNEFGVQSIMGWIRLTLNSHIVQGNFSLGDLYSLGLIGGDDGGLYGGDLNGGDVGGDL